MYLVLTNKQKQTSMQVITPIFAEKPEAILMKQASDQIAQALTEKHDLILSSIHGITSQTKKAYIRNVQHFLHFIQVNGINPHSFGQFRSELEGVDKSVKTKNAYLSAAKVLLKEAIKYRLLPLDITANVKAFKENKGHKKEGLTKAEVIKVMEYIKGIRNARKKAYLSALYDLFVLEGLRQIEVCRLKIEDFNAEDCYIKIQGKGQDDTEIHHISEMTAAAIQAHIILSGITSGYIFAGRSGRQMSTRAIQLRFEGIFEDLNIKGRSVHGFRHFFVTNMLQITNGDIIKTAQRSRHKNIQNVIIYNDSRVSRQQVAELAAYTYNLAL